LHLQQYILATVYPFVATLYIHTLKREGDQDQAYVENAKDKWRTLLAPTLIRFLGDAPYFMGETLSVIDLLAAKPLNNAHSLGMLSEFPTLHAVLKKVYSLPSFAKAYSEKEEAPCIECRSMLMMPGNSS
jgi:glutathione S-transferase